MKKQFVEVDALSTTCLCGGTLGVSETDDLLVHSMLIRLTAQMVMART